MTIVSSLISNYLFFKKSFFEVAIEKRNCENNYEKEINRAKRERHEQK